MLVGLPPNVKTVVATLHPAFAMHGTPQFRDGIRTTISRARSWANRGTQPDRSLRLHLTPTADQLRAALEAVDVVAVDIETPYDNHAHIIMVGLAVAPDTAYVVPWEAPYVEVVADLLTSPKKLKVGHNFAFDSAGFRANGVRPGPPIVDTLQAAALLWPPQPRSKKDAAAGKAALKVKFYELSACAARVLDGVAYWKQSYLPETQAFYRAAYPDVPEELQERLYCALDVIWTYRLWRAEEDLLRQRGMLELMTEIVAPAAVVLCDLEQRGMYVDTKVQADLVAQTKSEIAQAEARISDAAQGYHSHRISVIADKISKLEAQCAVWTIPITSESPSDPSVEAAPPSTTKRVRSVKKSKGCEAASPLARPN